MASTRLGSLAVGRETTRGLAVKPTKFLRFKEGDVNYNQEIIENNPIQNTRWNAITAVAGKIETEGSYTVDVDPNDIVFWLEAALGNRVTTDVGSPTNGSVFQHLINGACKVGSLTIEQAKGELCDDPMTSAGQAYQVSRAFGVLIDSLKVSGSDTILNAEVGVIAHGQFIKANMISNPITNTYYFDSVEGLVIGDTVKLVKGIDGTYQNLVIGTVNFVTNALTFSVPPTGSPTTAGNYKLELIPQTPSYQETRPFSFYNVKFRFADTVTNAYLAADENVENWEIEYMNNLETRFGSKRKSASKIGEKGNGCKIKFEKYFENVADRDRYLDQKKQALVVEMTNNEIVSGTDSTQKKYAINFEFSDIRFTAYEMPTGTDELYAVKLEGTAFYDTVDARAVRIKVINKNAAAFY